MKGKKVDMINKRFGRLLVLRKDDKKGNNGQLYWICNCDCGNEISVQGHSLRIGHSISCGCFKKEFIINYGKKYGYNPGTTNTDEYRIWKAMRYRCRNKNSTYYRIYGGKGIAVCERWEKSFIKFLEDMGNRPSKIHSIERLNSNKNYEPSNCKWATPKEQSGNTSRNRWLEHDGKKMIVADWAEYLGMPYASFSNALKRKSLNEIVLSINIR